MPEDQNQIMFDDPDTLVAPIEGYQVAIRYDTNTGEAKLVLIVTTPRNNENKRVQGLLPLDKKDVAALISELGATLERLLEGDFEEEIALVEKEQLKGRLS